MVVKMHNILSEFPNTIVLYLKGEVTVHNTVTAPEPCTSLWTVSDDLFSISWFAYAAASSESASLRLENHLDLMTSLFLALYHTSH